MAKDKLTKCQFLGQSVTKIRGAETVATGTCVRACMAIEGVIVAYYYVSFRLWFAGQLTMAIAMSKRETDGETSMVGLILPLCELRR